MAEEREESRLHRPGVEQRAGEAGGMDAPLGDGLGDLPDDGTAIRDAQPGGPVVEVIDAFVESAGSA